MPPKTTPMFKQYWDLKDKHQDCILFFRMGDFYEMFFDDAKMAARTLEIALTSRNKNDENPVPMCGVPHHSARGYISRLIDSGFKVAICEQVEDPKQAKGLVKREVVRVVTAATLTDPNFLEPKESNFLAAADPRLDGFGPKRMGLAFMDLSTGRFRVREVDSLTSLAGEIARLRPSELLLPASFVGTPEYRSLAAEASLGREGRTRAEPVEEELFDRRRAVDLILSHFKAPDLRTLGIDELSAGLSSAGAVLAYAGKTRRAGLDHVVELRVENPDSYMRLDETTQRHLELFFTLWGKRGKGTLIQVMDQTKTAMGGRLIRQWLANPLTDLEAIENRQEAVASFFEARTEREELRELLGRVADLERLCGRVVMNRALPRELVSLKNSIHNLGQVRDAVLELSGPVLSALVQEMDLLNDLALDIGRTVLDDPAPILTEGGIIRPGHSPKLDELVNLRSNSQDYILALESRERERTGINSLKVKFNKVFGYYIEVSKANSDKVPEEYQRKQTLVNHERYTTPELAEYEEKALSAGAAAAEMEYNLFLDLRSRVASQARRIMATAATLARLDCLAGLAQAAKANDYHRPSFNTQGLISLTQSRHPVVEKVFLDEPFVPNDLLLDMTERQILILTGPNMAGKSTILRQVGLAQIMAQMGGFVPAREASLSLVDRLFTRVGAGDDLARGRSTFMVEMSETARILSRATPDSLVLLDEIGRGTSTFDGLSLAWAVAEFLHDLEGKGVKTLLATHYHELIELAGQKGRVKNYTMAVRKIGERIVFMRNLTPGGVSRSYGIEVAKVAGLPPRAVARAREILAGLEKGAPQVLPRLDGSPAQPDLFASPGPDLLRERIKELEPERTTPLEALQVLAELKEMV